MTNKVANVTHTVCQTKTASQILYSHQATVLKEPVTW